jgi:acyl dehydratase
MTRKTTGEDAPRALSVDEFEARIGQDIALSPWLTMDQKRIDAFADVTQDHQFIHVDPEAAAKTVFGGPIAHGFLTLSMLSHFAEAVPPVAGRVMGVNYGFDKIRFLAPVRAGKRVRARFHLTDLTRRSESEIMTRFLVTVEIEGEDKPALSADWLGLSRLG